MGNISHRLGEKLGADAIRERRDRAPHTQDYIARRTQIDYATYARMRGKFMSETDVLG